MLFRPFEETEMESDKEEEKRRFENIYSVDVTSKGFLQLPPEARHEILTELLETKKQNSWKILDEMPKNSENFSDFQMNRLLKRHAVQVSLEKTGKEMESCTLNLAELESLLEEKGVLNINNENLPGKRIAKDNVTRYMLVKKNSGNDLKGVKEENEKLSCEGNDANQINYDDYYWSSDSETDVILKKSKMESKEGIPEKENRTRENIDPTRVKEKMNEYYGNENDNFGLNADVKQQRKSDKFEENEKVNEMIVTENKMAEEKNINELNKFENESFRVEPIENVENSVNKSESRDVYDKTTSSSEPEMEFKNEKQESNDLKEVKVDESSLQNLSGVEPTKDAKVEEIVDDSSPSSSDEESIFNTVEDVNNKETEINEKFLNSPADIENEKKNLNSNDCISIIISPSSKISETDDIFADVFNDPVEKNVEEENNVVVVVKDGNDVGIPTTDQNGGPPRPPSVPVESYKSEFEGYAGKLEDLKKSLEEKQNNLLLEQGNQERHALNPTDQMYSDAQVREEEEEEEE